MSRRATPLLVDDIWEAIEKVVGLLGSGLSLYFNTENSAEIRSRLGKASILRKDSKS